MWMPTTQIEQSHQAGLKIFVVKIFSTGVPGIEWGALLCGRFCKAGGNCEKFFL
jgi:hypothetical protein